MKKFVMRMIVILATVLVLVNCDTGGGWDSNVNIEDPDRINIHFLDGNTNCECGDTGVIISFDTDYGPNTDAWLTILNEIDGEFYHYQGFSISLVTQYLCLPPGFYRVEIGGMNFSSSVEFAVNEGEMSELVMVVEPFTPVTTTVSFDFVPADWNFHEAVCQLFYWDGTGYSFDRDFTQTIGSFSLELEENDYLILIAGDGFHSEFYFYVGGPGPLNFTIQLQPDEVQQSVNLTFNPTAWNGQAAHFFVYRYNEELDLYEDYEEFDGFIENFSIVLDYGQYKINVLGDGFGGTGLFQVSDTGPVFVEISMFPVVETIEVVAELPLQHVGKAATLEVYDVSSGNKVLVQEHSLNTAEHNTLWLEPGFYALRFVGDEIWCQERLDLPSGAPPKTVEMEKIYIPVDIDTSPWAVMITSDSPSGLHVPGLIDTLKFEVINISDQSQFLNEVVINVYRTCNLIGDSYLEVYGGITWAFYGGPSSGFADIFTFNSTFVVEPEESRLFLFSSHVDSQDSTNDVYQASILSIGGYWLTNEIFGNVITF